MSKISGQNGGGFIWNFRSYRKYCRCLLNISEDKITKESAFVDDLKANSLDVFRIITEIEDQFGIQIPDDAIENIVTVRRCSNSVQNALAK